MNDSAKPWWIGTGYEVCEPIFEGGQTASLTATYTPNNGIKLRLESHEEEDDGAWIEFHPDREQAVWLANRLLAWASHNHR
jgi:hypothetical protein